MSVIRVHKNKNFTVMSNAHLRDMNLSLKAKGLLSVMLSLPDNWNYSIAGLCSICKENETAIKSTIKELKEKCYVVVDKKFPNQTESKKYEYVYNIFEEPQAENQAIENQGVENLPLDNLPIEIHPLNKRTDIPNTDKSNTDTVNTDGLNTDNNSLSNDKDNSKTKVLDPHNSPVSEEKQETHTSKTLGRKTHTPKQTPLKDMPTRARGMANRLVDNTETADKMFDCITYFLKQYKTHRRKEHIHLTDDKLHEVVETLLSTITIPIMQTDGTSLENDYNPLVADNVDEDEMKWVIDEYFNTQFRERTDYSLVHFTQDGVLTNVMNKCILGGDRWFVCHEPN